MPAFSQTTLSALHSNIRLLYTRRCQVGKLFLTHEEFIASFVPLEARDLFRDIAQYMSPDTRVHRFKLAVGGTEEQAYIHMGDLGGRTPPVPDKIRIQRDAPPEIVRRIEAWMASGGNPSRDFGRVAKVLNTLNGFCSKNMVRYYWPTVIAIASESETTQQMAKDLQELRVPASVRSLPTGLLAACKQSAETIATARLISKDIISTDPVGGVHIDIVPGQSYNEAHGMFYGIT